MRRSVTNALKDIHCYSYGGPQLSRQNTIHHGKIQFITAKYNSKQQIQITHGKLQTLTAKTKTIIAI